MSEIDFVYRCQKEADLQCAETCVGVEACDACQCSILPLEAGGPWGDIMDVIFCLFPIVFLIIVTIKPNPYPTTVSLPMAAFFMFLVRLMYLESDPLLTCASIVLGLHEALIPLSIMAGAITLFETMEVTYCMPYMMREMKALTAGHPIAESMLIFAFAYLIEGASGFGTPVALGAPMLVSTGNDKLKSVVTLLVMNTFATVWGAVGTPIWFGLGALFSEEEIQNGAYLQVSYKAGICLAISAFLFMPPLLCILCPWDLVKKNLVFVYLSLATVVGPSMGLSFVNEEFPALIGGMVGCLGTAILIKYRVGLSSLEALTEKEEEERDWMEIGSVSEHSIVKKIAEARSVSASATSSNGHQTSSMAVRKNYKHASSSLSDVTTEAFSSRRPDEATTDENKDLESDDDGITNGVSSKSYTLPTRQEATTVPEERSIAIMPEALLNPEGIGTTISQRDELDVILGPRREFGEGYIRELLCRTSPIWLVILLLVLTRVEQIGLKSVLQDIEPNFSIFLGTFGTFRLSATLVFQLRNILSYPNLNWKFELLYLPFFMPFVLVSLFTMAFYRKDLRRSPREIATVVIQRLTEPSIALMGAMCLVQLLLKTDSASPSFILGTVLSDWFQEGFVVITPLVGALGSFFSGSTTVSNLTFGTIQTLAAESIGVSKTSLLALQAIGGSAGNGICLNNIIAACAVVGLDVGEGAILKQTYKFVLGITTLSTIIMLGFFLRF